MSKNQFNILCIFIIGFILISIFPPWIAYKYTTIDGEGIGKPSFIGFHFIFLKQHIILGEKPYTDAEISYKLWGIFYFILLLIGSFTILILRVIKVYGQKKS